MSFPFINFLLLALRSLSESLFNYFWIFLVSIASLRPASMSFFVKSITLPRYYLYTTVFGRSNFFIFFFDELFVTGWLGFVGVLGTTVVGFGRLFEDLFVFGGIYISATPRVFSVYSFSFFINILVSLVPPRLFFLDNLDFFGGSGGLPSSLISFSSLAPSSPATIGSFSGSFLLSQFPNCGQLAWCFARY